jgi:hypothetical protein
MAKIGWKEEVINLVDVEGYLQGSSPKSTRLSKIEGKTPLLQTAKEGSEGSINIYI